MEKPVFAPLAGDSFRIEYPASYRASNALCRRFLGGEIPPGDAPGALREALAGSPYNFNVAYSLGELLMERGEMEESCGVRFEACKRLMEILPDDEISLEWDDGDNTNTLLLLHASATDHFLIGDPEISAAMWETVLDLDGEDRLNVSKMLAYCYVALGERESFDDILPDVEDKDPEKTLLMLWAGFRFSGELDGALLERLKNRHREIYEEFTAPEHPLDETFSGDDAARSHARGIWLRTESLWNGSFGDFIEALKSA